MSTEEITDECVYAAWEQSGFDPTDNIIFCQLFKADDYYQVFSITLIMFLICLATYLLPFSSYGAFARIINDARSTLTSVEGRQELQERIERLNQRESTLGRYSGMPFKFYLLFRAILSCVYLSIKILLLMNPSNDNRYMDINDRFNAGFNQFVNAENIILLIIIIHNISNVTKLTNIFTSRRGTFGFIKGIMLICLLIIWIDVIVSFVIIITKYSLLVLFLYEIAVLCLLGIAVVITSCCLVPILLCLVVTSCSIFGKISNDNCCGHFIMAFGAALSLVIIAYLLICCYLCFVFLFVGGPSDAVIYVNFNDRNQFIVVYLFGIAIFVGLLSIVVGSVYSYKDFNDPERQQLSNRLEYV